MIVKFYSPLSGALYRPNYWQVDENYNEECGENVSDNLIKYQTEILAALQRDSFADFDKAGLAQYLSEKHEPLVSKYVSCIRPTVEVKDGKLVGVCYCEIQDVEAELCHRLFKELTDYITGQYSDGWGEGFEQRSIKVPEGELYVSFWSHDLGWHLTSDVKSTFFNTKALMDKASELIKKVEELID